MRSWKRKDIEHFQKSVLHIAELQESPTTTSAPISAPTRETCTAQHWGLHTAQQRGTDPYPYGAQNLTVFLLDHLSNSPYHTSDNLPVMLGEGLGNILVYWKYFAMFWQHQLKDILSPKSCKSPVTVIVSYGYCAEKRSVGNMYFSPSLLVYFMHLKILCG